jgi:hypothetical protein
MKLREQHKRRDFFQVVFRDLNLHDIPDSLSCPTTSNQKGDQQISRPRTHSVNEDESTEQPNNLSNSIPNIVRSHSTNKNISRSNVSIPNTPILNNFTPITSIMTIARSTSSNQSISRQNFGRLNTTSIPTSSTPTLPPFNSIMPQNTKPFVSSLNISPPKTASPSKRIPLSTSFLITPPRSSPTMALLNVSPPKVRSTHSSSELPSTKTLSPKKISLRTSPPIMTTMKSASDVISLKTSPQKNSIRVTPPPPTNGILLNTSPQKNTVRNTTPPLKETSPNASPQKNTVRNTTPPLKETSLNTSPTCTSILTSPKKKGPLHTSPALKVISMNISPPVNRERGNEQQGKTSPLFGESVRKFRSSTSLVVHLNDLRVDEPFTIELPPSVQENLMHTFPVDNEDVGTTTPLQFTYNENLTEMKKMYGCYVGKNSSLPSIDGYLANPPSRSRSPLSQKSDSLSIDERDSLSDISIEDIDNNKEDDSSLSDDQREQEVTSTQILDGYAIAREKFVAQKDNFFDDSDKDGHVGIPTEFSQLASSNKSSANLSELAKREKRFHRKKTVKKKKEKRKKTNSTGKKSTPLLSTDNESLIESTPLDAWNVRFQKCLERLNQLENNQCHLEERIDANIELMHLSEDFVHASRTVGKIIISEVFM